MMKLISPPWLHTLLVLLWFLSWPRIFPGLLCHCQPQQLSLGAQVWVDNHSRDKTALRKLHRVRCATWKKPPPGLLSVCLDGAFDPNTMSGGVGIVVRDCHGNFHSGMATTIAHVSSPAHIEAIAAVTACRFVLDHGLSPTKFETDSVQLVQAVSSPLSSDHPQLGDGYEDVGDLFMQLPGCSISHISCEGNEAAHKLAVWALATQPCHVYFSSVPPILEEIISAERL